MNRNFERLPVDEARPRPLVLAGLFLCVLTVIFCFWQTRDKQQAALAHKPTQSVVAKQNARPENWKRQQRAVVPTVSVPLDTNEANLNKFGLTLKGSHAVTVSDPPTKK